MTASSHLRISDREERKRLPRTLGTAKANILVSVNNAESPVSGGRRAASSWASPFLRMLPLQSRNGFSNGSGPCLLREEQRLRSSLHR